MLNTEKIPSQSWRVWRCGRRDRNRNKTWGQGEPKKQPGIIKGKPKDCINQKIKWSEKIEVKNAYAEYVRHRVEHWQQITTPGGEKCGMECDR